MISVKPCIMLSLPILDIVFNLKAPVSILYLLKIKLIRTITESEN